jgi:5'-phosphate synthase pdxT subunit
MVDVISVGILGIQGAISEHITLMTKALEKARIPGKIVVVNRKNEIDEIDALILPGGESTTISRVLQQSGLYDTIVRRIQENTLPILGTCAGCALLAKEITDRNHHIQPLQAMDIQVTRNAFGRQKESFEQDIDFKGFSQPYHAVFIRAPLITKVWGTCDVLAKLDEKIVAARQDNFLALSFHPELTDDLRVHTYFLEMV